MIARRFALCLPLLLAQPTQAQENPLEMLFPDTRMVIAAPEGMDVRHDTVTLEIGI